jgi:hypothetical protein
MDALALQAQIVIISSSIYEHPSCLSRRSLNDYDLPRPGRIATGLVAGATVGITCQYNSVSIGIGGSRAFVGRAAVD